MKCNREVFTWKRTRDTGFLGRIREHEGKTGLSVLDAPRLFSRQCHRVKPPGLRQTMPIRFAVTAAPGCLVAPLSVSLSSGYSGSPLLNLDSLPFLYRNGPCVHVAGGSYFGSRASQGNTSGFPAIWFSTPLLTSALALLQNLFPRLEMDMKCTGSLILMEICLADP